MDENSSEYLAHNFLERKSRNKGFYDPAADKYDSAEDAVMMLSRKMICDMYFIPSYNMHEKKI